MSVREDRPLTRELVHRFAGQGARRSLGVTDLVALRRAYFRSMAPEVPFPADRQRRIDRGRAFHRSLGIRLAKEGLLEARVRREEFVGRIDILADLPIELKTSASFVDPVQLPHDRPDQVEQLGMYCALLGCAAGRLVTVVVEPENVPAVQSVDISFDSPESVLSEMRGRAGLLRAAWSEARPNGLPRCPWFGRGCEYEEAKVCGCTGNEPPTSPGILEQARTVTARPDVSDRLRDALSGPRLSERPATVARFRDLLYPRRAYFDRTAPPLPPAPAPAGAAAPVPLLAPDLHGRLTEALESGPPGEVARLPPRSAEPEEEVTGYRGRPLLVRTSRAWSRLDEGDLLTRAPQYALELGLRCAVTGTSSGVVVLGYERAENDPDRIQVLEIRYASVTPFSRFVRERSRSLSVALRDRSAAELAACPGWMVADCPYRSECGCGGEGSRDTR